MFYNLTHIEVRGERHVSTLAQVTNKHGDGMYGGELVEEGGGGDLVNLPKKGK